MHVYMCVCIVYIHINHDKEEESVKLTNILEDWYHTMKNLILQH